MLLVKLLASGGGELYDWQAKNMFLVMNWMVTLSTF